MPRWKRTPFASSAIHSLGTRLRTHVDRLAGLIGPRYTARPSSMAAATAYIEREFEGIGDTVDRETYDVPDGPVDNLIIERPGTTAPAEIVLLGAHYDTVSTTPGADDNASAVAVMIEAARLLHGLNHARTIRFVAFACEEQPHFHTGSMGSQVHARACTQREENIVGMFCLEMVGYFTDKPGSQGIPPAIPKPLRWAFPSRGNFIAAVGNPRSLGLCTRFRRGFKRVTRLPLFSIVLPERIHEIRRSDNSSFWDQGYPALMITDTSYLRNPHYHEPTDTPDTLDYARMVDVAIGVAGAVHHLARRA